MITLPKNLTATKYPGYFWDVVDHQLYSIKVGGILRRMTPIKPNKYCPISEPAYRVSVDGKKRYLVVSYHLLPLTLTDSEIPLND